MLGINFKDLVLIGLSPWIFKPCGWVFGPLEWFQRIKLEILSFLIAFGSRSEPWSPWNWRKQLNVLRCWNSGKHDVFTKPTRHVGWGFPDYLDDWRTRCVQGATRHVWSHGLLTLTLTRSVIKVDLGMCWAMFRSFGLLTWALALGPSYKEGKKVFYPSLDI